MLDFLLSVLFEIFIFGITIWVMVGMPSLVHHLSDLLGFSLKLLE